MAGSRRAGGHVAYEITGDRGPTLVWNWGWLSNIESFHEIPGYTRFIEQLARFARVVTFDVRGMGASGGAIGSFPDRVADLSAVVEAAASGPVIVAGASSGGALAIEYAATHPELVDGLILYAAYPRLLAKNDDLFFMATAEIFDRVRRGFGRWGSGGSSAAIAPSVAVTRDGRDLWKRIEGACTSADGAVASFDVDATIDVVDRLAEIRAPTLVMHRVNEQFIPPQAARFIAAHIPGTELVYLDGLDHYPWLANSDAVVQAIENFVHGVPARPPTMKGVLLTDIERSTARLLEVGESRWAEILEAHDRLAAESVAACDGELVKTTGDGILAVFDRPSDALRCAVAFRDASRTLDLGVRLGVAVGDVTVRGRDVSGLSIHMAERIAKLAEPGQILVSRGVTILLSETRFEWLGTRSFRGIPADRSVFELR